MCTFYLFCLISLFCINLISNIPTAQTTYCNINIIEISDVDGIVYVTEFGEVYHLRDCSYIKPTSHLKIGTIKSFKAEGYRACSRCTPDYYYSDDYKINDNSEEENIPEEKPPIDIVDIFVLIALSLILLINLVYLILIIRNCKSEQVSLSKFSTTLILIVINLAVAIGFIIDFSINFRLTALLLLAIHIDGITSAFTHYSYVHNK